MKKFDTFNKKNVKYSNDGKNDICPVCSSDDINSDLEDQFYDSVCNNCKFNFWVEVNNVADYILNDIDNSDIVFNQPIHQPNNKVKELNKELTYLHSGEHSCPFCDHELSDPYINNSGDGQWYAYNCDKCDSNWTIYEKEVVIEATDEFNNVIKTGGKITTDFDFDNYTKLKLSQLKNDFNI